MNQGVLFTLFILAIFMIAISAVSLQTLNDIKPDCGISDTDKENRTIFSKLLLGISTTYVGIFLIYYIYLAVTKYRNSQGMVNNQMYPRGQPVVVDYNNRPRMKRNNPRMDVAGENVRVNDGYYQFGRRRY